MQRGPGCLLLYLGFLSGGFAGGACGLLYDRAAAQRMHDEGLTVDFLPVVTLLGTVLGSVAGTVAAVKLSRLITATREPRKHPRDQPRPRPPLWCWIVYAFGAVLVYLVFQFFHPPDWVDVTVGPFPVGRWEYFLLAEDSGGVGPLAYYETKVFPFTMMPGKDISGKEVPGGEWDTYSYQWRNASRYGVLARGGDGRWLLWWLGPDEVHEPSLMRYILGGGTANIRLPDKSRAEVPTRQFLDRLGLSR